MRRYMLLLPALAIAVGTSAAQQPPAQPTGAAGQQPAVTFRTETNFV